MNTKKILKTEIADLQISSLPSRPTAPTAFGGKGYTANQMKAAFDRLPLFIIEKFNALLDDVGGIGEGSLAYEIPTAILEGHTLGELFEDILSGRFSSYLSMGEESLAELKIRLSEENESIEERLAICLLHIADTVIDAATPSARDADCGEVKK